MIIGTPINSVELEKNQTISGVPVPISIGKKKIRWEGQT